MSTLKSSKRGRPKRKPEEGNDSSEQFAGKKGLRKLSKVASKKNAELDRKKKKKEKQKSKREVEDSDDFSESVEVEEQNPIKIMMVPVELFKSDKIFADILGKANKEPQFLIMMRNLLSGYSRILKDKRISIKKKWEQLRNSNCTQDQYLSRDAELKRLQYEQIYDIEKDIMGKLSFANIRGFESKQVIIESFKQQQGAQGEDAQFVIEDQPWDKYHQEQKKLINLLLNQKDFVFEQKGYRPEPKIQKDVKPNSQAEENQINLKFLNIETQQNPQSTQFLFCKHYAEVNYQKVFENSINPFKVQESDIYYMDPKAVSWILQTKSDEIYTNERFQKQTYKRYTELLQNIYKNSSSMSDTELIEQLLEIAAYILNSVHYYQKFKLKCDLLHPLDLLLVIERIKKERKKLKENMEKSLEVIEEEIKQFEAMVEE